MNRIDPEVDASTLSLFKSYENAFIWPYSHIQFGIIVFVLNSGQSKYRRNVYTNWVFIIYWLFIMLLMFYGLLFLRLDFRDGELLERFIGWMFDIKLYIPFSFRILQFSLSLLHLFFGIMLETILRPIYMEKSVT